VMFDGCKQHIDVILRVVKRLLERIDALKPVQRIVLIGQDSARGVIVQTGLFLAFLRNDKEAVPIGTTGATRASTRNSDREHSR